MKNRIVSIFLLLIVGLAHGEGTKELRKKYEDAYFINFIPSTGKLGQGFMGYDCPFEEKLFIHIEKPGEWIHLGFGQYFINQTANNKSSASNNQKLYFRLRKASGESVLEGLVPQEGEGYIGDESENSYNRCVVGPNRLNDSGYSSLSIETFERGDYFLEFNVGDSSLSNTVDWASFQLFDVSVSEDAGKYSGIDSSFSTSRIEGRVYSKSWNIGTGGVKLNSAIKYYHLKPSTKNEEVFYSAEISLPNFKAEELILSAHSSGFASTENENQNFCSNAFQLFPEHLIFLNAPDPKSYRIISQAPYSLEFNAHLSSQGEGQAIFIIKNAEPSTIRVQIDLNGQSGYQENSQDVELKASFKEIGYHALKFDGTSGKNQRLKNGKNLKTNILFRHNPTAIPLYNVVENIGGIYYRPISQNTASNNCFWKDESISSAEWYGKRTWPLGEGNHKTMVAWFYALDDESVNSLLYKWNDDFDNDGIRDHVDADTDNDGISNKIEGQGVDPLLDDNGNGIPNFTDPNFYHPISGVYKDENNDGINDVFDADLDSRMNYVDLDANQDGMLDIVAVGLSDDNKDGMIDHFNDTTGDGMSNNNAILEHLVKDFDNDGVADYLDADADDDGLSNFIEIQDFMKFRRKKELDTDQNGIDDAFDIKADGLPITTPFDKNKNGIYDYLEVEKDGILYSNDLCRSKTVFDRQVECLDAIPPFTCFELDMGEADPLSTPMIFRWDLGDGDIVDGSKVKHCYKYFGNFNVSLSIVDPKSNSIIQENEYDMSLTIRDSMKLRINVPQEVTAGELFEFDFDFTPPMSYKIHRAYWSFDDYIYRCDYRGFHFFNRAGIVHVKLILVLRSENEEIELCATKNVLVK